MSEERECIDNVESRVFQRGAGDEEKSRRL